MMCKLGEETKIILKDGRGVMVDRCLAPYIQALNDSGIVTGISCCGHGEQAGFILAQRGEAYRLLIMVEEGEKSQRRFEKDFRQMASDFENRRKK
jgi:hypothetical protein